MDYEKAYKEALERARKLYEKGTITESLNYIFPELKESEDERIRKELIDAIQGLWDNDTLPLPLSAKRKDAWIAWLEKQGEQEPANKVEPKFKIGYWITIDKPCQIISISDTGNYIVRYCDNEKTHILSKNFCESYFHLWTINNAEDGDVLTVNGRPFIYCCNNNYKGNYCGINSDGVFRTSFDFGFNGKTILPATKEQRDLLFSKMKEAGYEWDAKDKELKKTETKGGEKLTTTKVIYLFQQHST